MVAGIQNPLFQDMICAAFKNLMYYSGTIGVLDIAVEIEPSPTE
jgi:hypothetical protein